MIFHVIIGALYRGNRTVSPSMIAPVATVKCDPLVVEKRLCLLDFAYVTL
jgi:hypothetical protein